MNSITEGEINMKTVLKQIGKAAAYFATYLATSNLISLIVSFVHSYMKGREYALMGLSREEGYALYQAEAASITGICLGLGAIATLLVYFIVEKVKRSSLAKETDMKKVSAGQLGLTIMGAAGAMVFMNNILSILPIPEELMGGLQSGMSNLTAYPFWQAILVNAILVPILEEVVFRGYIYNRLSKAMPSVVAALISSVVFGICHGSILWAVWAFLIGMIICAVRVKSGSIIPGIIFHIILNAYAMIVSYFHIYKGASDTLMYVLTAIGAAMLAAYLFFILRDKNASSKKIKPEVVISAKE